MTTVIGIGLFFAAAASVMWAGERLAAWMDRLDERR